MRKSIVSVVVAALTAVTISGAHAATVSHWAEISDLDDTGSATVTMPDVTGFPVATLQTDSRGPAGRISGASSWLADSTNPGAVYGSSRGLPYLSLRPVGSTEDTPSTSTYTFSTPTPTSGWTFALGDIDAEFLEVSALDAAGDPVAIADLGFRTAFNYCQGAGTPSCDSSKPQPLPLWDSTTGRLSGPQVDDAGEPIEWGNTEGTAAWFEPTVPLSSLTVTSTWLAGFPAYQTWFAALSRDISGTVTGSDDCSVDGLDVLLRNGDDAEVDRTTTEAGAWFFNGLATYDDWTVSLTPPDGCDVVGEDTRTADLSADDAVIAMELEQTPEPEPEPDPEPTDETGGSTSPSDPAAGGDTAGAVGSRNTLLPDTGGSSPWTPAIGLLLVLTGLVLTARPGRGQHRA